MNKINRLYWLYGPVFLLITQILIEVLADKPLKRKLLDEGGIHEGLQALVMLVGAILAARLLMRANSLWLKIWFGIALLGCIYVTGEEVSWGQWIFNWATPDGWGEINDQNETNLHNISDWLDQKPQALLQIGVLVGGIIIPLLGHYAPTKLPERFKAVYGGLELLPISLIALGLKIIDTISDRIDMALFYRVSEILELFIYYFVALYLYTMWKKKPSPASS